MGYINKATVIDILTNSIEINMEIPYDDRIHNTLELLSSILGININTPIIVTEPTKIYFTVPEKVKYTNYNHTDYIDYEILCKIVYKKIVDLLCSNIDSTTCDINEMRKHIRLNTIFYSEVRCDEIYYNDTIDRVIDNYIEYVRVFNDIKIIKHEIIFNII